MSEVPTICGFPTTNWLHVCVYITLIGCAGIIFLAGMTTKLVPLPLVLYNTVLLVINGFAIKGCKRKSIRDLIPYAIFRFIDIAMHVALMVFMALGKLGTLVDYKNIALKLGSTDSTFAIFIYFMCLIVIGVDAFAIWLVVRCRKIFKEEREREPWLYENYWSEYGL